MVGAALLLFPLGFLCAFLFVFSLLFGLFWVPGDHGGEEGQRLMTADWGLITGAGKAYDSGRGGGSLCAFLFVFSLLFGLLLLLLLLCCGVVVVWLLCGCCVVVVWLLCGCCGVVVGLLWGCCFFFFCESDSFIF